MPSLDAFRLFLPVRVKRLIPTSVKKALLYLLRFGPFKGVSTLFSLNSRTDGIITVSIPQAHTPIFLRAKSSDIQIFEEIFVDQDYELPGRLNPKLIIDGGANTGYASVFFANRYPHASIVAVEPEKSNVEILQKNTAAYPRIKILQAGIWHRQAFLKLENSNAPKASFRLEETEESVAAIRAMTIDEILCLEGGNFIDILKLDIEGAEKEVLLAGQSWLHKVGVLIIELHDRYVPGCTESLNSAIADLNFKKYQRGVNIFLIMDPQILPV